MRDEPELAVGPIRRHSAWASARTARECLAMGMAVDLLIEVDNKPGELAKVAGAISDSGVNISAATCIGPGGTAALHILVKHAEAAKHALATAGVTVRSQREVVVVEADDRPGILADLARKVARAGVNLDLLYLATKTRIVFGSPDLDGLRRALGVASDA